jgi:hypothetical protein
MNRSIVQRIVRQSVCVLVFLTRDMIKSVRSWQSAQVLSYFFRKLLLKLADHYGKIRLIMLHKLKFAGRSACSTPITCDASLIRAIDPGIGACSLRRF